MAFVGSSYTWVGVDAARLSRMLYGETDTVVNFGVNWHGRDRDYLVARELLALDRLDTLVLEVGERERSQVHPYFHRLASWPDSLRDPLLRSPDIYEPTRLRSLTTYAVRASLGNTVSGYAQLVDRLRNWSQWAGADPSELFDSHQGYLPQSGRLRRLPPPPPDPPDRPAKHDRGGWYLERIARLCDGAGVRLLFLEMPVFGGAGMPDGYRAALEELGGVVLSHPDPASLYQRSYWYHHNHLNASGAAVFTEWLGGALSARLAPPARPGEPAGP